MHCLKWEHAATARLRETGSQAGAALPLMLVHWLLLVFGACIGSHLRDVGD